MGEPPETSPSLRSVEGEGTDGFEATNWSGGFVFIQIHPDSRFSINFVGKEAKGDERGEIK